LGKQQKNRHPSKSDKASNADWVQQRILDAKACHQRSIRSCTKQVDGECLQEWTTKMSPVRG
jgi:hypothetical protein